MVCSIRSIRRRRESYNTTIICAAFSNLGFSVVSPDNQQRREFPLWKEVPEGRLSENANAGRPTGTPHDLDLGHGAFHGRGGILPFLAAERRSVKKPNEFFARSRENCFGHLGRITPGFVQPARRLSAI